MNGVMDSIKARSLRALREVGLAGGRAVFGLNAHLEVLLGGVGHHFAQQLSELRGMLGLFVGSLLPVQANLGIAFAMGNARHSEVHADLGAFALEVRAKVRHDVLRDLRKLADADHMLGSPGHFGLALLDETAPVNAALRALEVLRQRVAVELLHVTAHRTHEFHWLSPIQDRFGSSPLPFTIRLSKAKGT